MKKSWANSMVSIKNGYMAMKTSVLVYKNTMFLNILKLLKQDKIIDSFVIDNKMITVYLNYFENDNGKKIPALKNIKFFSLTKTRQLYQSAPKYSNSPFLIKIFSTNKGILNCAQCIKYNVGGIKLMEIQ